MPNDTKNSLIEFDMCLALAQKAVNSQMTAAWKSWIARSDLLGDSEMKDFAIVSIYDDEFQTSGIEVEFDPLTVSLCVPNGKLGQVQVTLHLKSGKVFTEKTNFKRSETKAIDGEVEQMIKEAVRRQELSSDKAEENEVFDEYKAKYKKLHPEQFRVETSIFNWDISFITDLDKQPCDLDLLEKIDPTVRGTVQDIVNKTGLPESVFSIEYLFMKFTQVNLLLEGNRNFPSPTGVDVPEAAMTKTCTSLNKMLQGSAGNFMLGTVVRRSKDNSKEPILPTFALTDFIFNVYPDPFPEASTLSYLGMFARRPLPANWNTARIALADNWIRREMIDGTQGSISGVMAISKQVFMEKYLIAAFSNSLQGETCIPSGLTWTFTRQEQICKRSGREACIIPPTFYLNCDYDSARDYLLKLEIQPGTNQIKISGRMNSHATYDGHTPDLGFLGGNDHVSWIHYRGYADISGTVTLEGQGIGREFKFNPRLEFNISPVQVTESETEGLAKVTEAGGSVLDTLGIIDDTPAKALAHMQRSVLDGLRKALEDELKNLQLDLSQHAFVPPGGGVFTFQNPRFSQVGDLIFDAIYQAP
jgi:hypothetical protein